MKKIISLLLIIVLSLSVIGCGSGNKSKSDQIVGTWNHSYAMIDDEIVSKDEMALTGFGGLELIVREDLTFTMDYSGVLLSGKVIIHESDTGTLYALQTLDGQDAGAVLWISKELPSELIFYLDDTPNFVIILEK